MAFKVSLCLPKEAEINSGEKSSVGRYSKVEMAEASSLSRLIAARSRSLRAFQTHADSALKGIP